MPGGNLNRVTVFHSPQGDDHTDGEEYAGDDASYAKEEHFSFNVFDDAGLLGDMEMVNQCLQALFVHEISEIAQCSGQHKEENGCASDDGYFDPFQFREEGDT